MDFDFVLLRVVLVNIVLDAVAQMLRRLLVIFDLFDSAHVCLKLLVLAFMDALLRLIHVLDAVRGGRGTVIHVVALLDTRW